MSNNIKFDFGNKADSNELKELTEANVAETQADMPELTDNTSNELENHNEVDSKATENKKAVLTFIGNGEWKDSKGEMWSRNERPSAEVLATRSYLESEYEGREDLKFMVRYGEMKVSLV